MTARREYGTALVVAAAGAALILIAVRRPWARVTFVAPRPLPAQTVNVSGQDLLPLAGALALAGLACLAAVIATRGMARRIAGGILAVLGAWAGIAALASVSAASASGVAASKAGSPGASAASGAVGSTTSGSSGGGSTVVVSGTTSHVSMSGGEWRFVVLLGALAIAAAGVAVVLRGPRWAVMSARYDSGSGRPQAADSASMWESLSSGADPTATDPAQTDPAQTEPAQTDPADTQPADTQPADTEETGAENSPRR
jgi:uncharacterized membrane protein (TIGR02234 family)